MELQYVIGDITTVEKGVIVHGVNCQGVMGSGIAKAIRDKWPQVYTDYQAHCEGRSNTDLLGTWQFVYINTNISVVNLFSQNQYGKTGERFAKPDKIEKALRNLITTLIEYKIEHPLCSAKIGCGLGGLSWENEIKPIYETIIQELNPQFPVIIYDNKIK